MPKFIPRQRKHKVRQREATTKNASANTNQVQIVPESVLQVEEKRQKLREDRRASQAKVSGKKQKRLDKYIETKLKREENLELLKKLSEEKFDTSRLQSSKHLGKRKFRDYLDGHIHTHKQLKKTEQDLAEPGADWDSEDSFEQERGDAFTDIDGDLSIIPKQSPAAGLQIGSGLKQPLLLGSDGLPIPQSRKKKADSLSLPGDAEIPWEGFDSEPECPVHSSGEVSAEEENDGLDTEGESADDSSHGSSDITEVSDGNEEEDSNTPEVFGGRLKPRESAFKRWATEQINKSLDYTPQNAVDVHGTGDRTAPTLLVPPPLVDDPRDVQPAVDTGRQAYHVQVSRSPLTDETRLGLPILAEEQKIMEAIHNNAVTIVWGSTGSGKTTQVPQFLFEAGYGDPASSTPGMIGVTQPRRVAAVSMAKRVSEELGSHGDRVSYQIRFDSTASSRTAIKFMTDGILLREVSQDVSLRKYSVIVIDEAHERSVNTDILIGMLSRIVEQRSKADPADNVVRPLKLVIMSATLRVSDFLQNNRLFRSGIPPFVQAEGRQHPVTVHFSRRTHRDYVEEAFRKVTKAHRQLPHGGILVFLTGQNEIKALLTRLENALSPGMAPKPSPRVQIAASEAPLETEDFQLHLDKKQHNDDDDDDGGGNDDEEQEGTSDLEIIMEDNHDQNDENDFDIGEAPSSTTGVHILPLYSQLPTKEQLQIFDPPPPGSRLIVLATNVAETSLTIPGIRYVFDCGRSKERLYDPITGVQSFEVGWISRASAEQRKGRAGRTGPGHCYRLYSSAVYERDFMEHADPEILRTPIESVVLQLKNIGIDKVAHFPFPTPPDRDSLLKAEKLLRNLGALSESGQVTTLGRSLSSYPLSPRFGKMLALGHQLECMPYVIALVAGLSVGDLFVPENQVDLTPVGRQEDQIYSQADHDRDTQREQRRKQYNEARAAFSQYDPTSDVLKLLTAVCAYAWEASDSWCEKKFLRTKAMKETMQLRQQLTSIVHANNPLAAQTDCVGQLQPATSKQLKALNQIVTAGFIDQIAIRADCLPNPPDVAARRAKRAIDVPYLPLVGDEAVYLHPSSVLARTSPEKLPKYLVYSHLQQSTASRVDDQTAKIRMFPLTATSDLQLAALAHDSPLLTYGKPIGKIESLGGRPEKRECVVVPALVGKPGSIGWPLTAKKVLQVKHPRQGWIVEKFLS